MLTLISMVGRQVRNYSLHSVGSRGDSFQRDGTRVARQFPDLPSSPSLPNFANPCMPSRQLMWAVDVHLICYGLDAVPFLPSGVSPRRWHALEAASSTGTRASILAIAAE